MTDHCPTDFLGISVARTHFNTCTLLSRYIAVHFAGTLFEFIFTDILRSDW